MTDKLCRLILIRLKDLRAELVAIGFEEKAVVQAIYAAALALQPNTEPPTGEEHESPKNV